MEIYNIGNYQDLRRKIKDKTFIEDGIEPIIYILDYSSGFDSNLANSIAKIIERKQNHDKGVVS